MVNDEVSIQDLPWWTSDEIERDMQEWNTYISDPKNAERAYPHYDPERMKGYTGSDIKWLFFDKEVLNKFLKHPLVHAGYDEDSGYNFLRWLSTDPHAEALAKLHYLTPFNNRFNKRFVGIPDNDNLIAIKEHEFSNVPPRQRPLMVSDLSVWPKVI
jgi:hypothetical protein